MKNKKISVTILPRLFISSFGLYPTTTDNLKYYITSQLVQSHSNLIIRYNKAIKQRIFLVKQILKIKLIQHYQLDILNFI
ncbi:hypothetical protein [Candidatus Stoquefichus sp. SB1]|uniref:hypothetical protein n=1 Tax=Candidatus Stoquefichus sp. SB1 TaxID=1658109 RepID=UPI00067E7161|nr:hypothetical protein [Candidatus Stoquefichus sp. SB1]